MELLNCPVVKTSFTCEQWIFTLKKKLFYLVFKLISKDHKKKWPLIFHSSKYITYSNN